MALDKCDVRIGMPTFRMFHHRRLRRLLRESSLPTGHQFDCHFRIGRIELGIDPIYSHLQLQRYLKFEEIKSEHILKLVNNAIEGSRQWIIDERICREAEKSNQESNEPENETSVSTNNWEKLNIDHYFHSQNCGTCCCKQSRINCNNIGVNPIPGFALPNLLIPKPNSDKAPTSFVPNQNNEKAMIYLNSEIQAGRPVVVGVSMQKPGKSFFDPTYFKIQNYVNHYVVIVDLTIAGSETTYTFYDVGNPRVAGNKFTFNMDKSGILTSNQTYMYPLTNGYQYNVIWINKNKK